MVPYRLLAKNDYNGICGTTRCSASHRQLQSDIVQDTDSYQEILCKTQTATMRKCARNGQLQSDFEKYTDSYHDILYNTIQRQQPCMMYCA
jgi:hypothetical protein